MTRSSPSEQTHPDAEPNFTRPRRNVITEGNWPAYEANGYVFIENNPDDADATHQSGIDSAENFFGTENVFTGHAFDLTEGRPLRHKPGFGIYIGPDGDLELAKSFQKIHEELDAERQSSDTGPASS